MSLGHRANAVFKIMVLILLILNAHLLSAHDDTVRVFSFVPDRDVTVRTSPDLSGTPVDIWQEGEEHVIYTPYVLGQNGYYFAATTEFRDRWVPVAASGICPMRERFGVWRNYGDPP